MLRLFSLRLTECLRKSCSFGLQYVTFKYVRPFVFVSLSSFVMKMGSGVYLY